ncbi:Endoglucanase [Acaryochloris thomasi RCC1774]|uniref:Endoglucanase n=1 Tax=Acaryochloris thomasi RCC1774 TaxID=1764569 RepID=A0A2W1K5C4_9CYAN|nr:S-layer homology domain-containing protein [Acaryochloris thomasi]PZD75101.1 Endoglucanase [Acaryochloris thomasi RCC1774]
MSSLFRRSAALVGGALVAIATPASAQDASFSDVNFSYWARPFIEELASKDIIKGFPDGSFKPNEPVTRAQFAAIVRQAFDQKAVRRYTAFNDVPSDFWAAPAVRKAYTTGFMSGYPGGKFEPTQRIPRVQALVSLSSGLELESPANTDKMLGMYQDAADIPDYANQGISAATAKGLVVNHPNVKYLNPNQSATRADVAAFVYQALVKQGQLQPIAAGSKTANYIVQATAPSQAAAQPEKPAANQPAGLLVAQGTDIALKYPGNAGTKIVVAPGETYETSLLVAQDITNANGRVLIPADSRIMGRFVPQNINGTTPATQFVADKLMVGNKSYPLNATSNPQVAVNETELKSTDLRTAVTSAAARTAVESALGRPVSVGNVLQNALGTQSPSTANNSVIVIDPNQLTLTTRAGLRVTAQK